jgi:hypothetical protein
MKILITESQLDDIYDDYITFLIGDLQKYTNVRKRNRFGYDTYEGHVFFVNENNEVIFEIDSLGRYWVSRDIIELFSNFFGFDFVLDHVILTNEFKKWVEKHFNVDNPKVFAAHYKDWERWKNLELKP